MFLHVFQKVEGLVVLFAAEFASIGVVVFDLLVVLELTLGDEPFVALFATEGLVLFEMRLQAVLVHEAPVTTLALERPLTCQGLMSWDFCDGHVGPLVCTVWQSVC